MAVDEFGFCTDVCVGAKHTHERIEWAIRFLGICPSEEKLVPFKMGNAEINERSLWPYLKQSVPQRALSLLRPLFPSMTSEKESFTAAGLAWNVIATMAAGRTGPVRLIIALDRTQYLPNKEYAGYDLKFVKQCLSKWKEMEMIEITKGNNVGEKAYRSSFRCEKLAEAFARALEGQGAEATQEPPQEPPLPLAAAHLKPLSKATESTPLDLKSAVFATLSSPTFFAGKRGLVDKPIRNKYKSVMSIIDDCMAPKDISNEDKTGKKYIYEKSKDGEADARKPKACRRAVSEVLDLELAFINGNQPEFSLCGRNVSNGAAYHAAEYVVEGYQTGGGRFYCPLQGLTPIIRRELLINGLKTVEMDLRASHLTQAYLMGGLVPDMSKDLYVDGFNWTKIGVSGETPALRKSVKILTNVILNAGGGGLSAVKRQCELKAVDAALAAADAADLVNEDIRDEVRFCFRHSHGERNAAAMNKRVTELLKARNGYSLPAIRELADELDEALRMNRQGTPAASSVWRSFDPKAMYDEICRLHRDIKGRLGSGFGLVGMANEGLVMRRTLMRLIAAGVPCPLQVHDSLHCREIDAPLVKRIWTEEWTKLLRHSPAIDLK